MRYYILFHPEKCCACGACAVACMDQNDVDVLHGEKGYRAVYEYEDAGGAMGECTYLSISCRHCADAPCVAGCPTGCLSKEPSTGMTVAERSRCIGCHSCAMACPFGIPRFSAGDGKVLKCDGCFVRLTCGLQPACVRACAFGALTCVDEAEFRRLEENHAISAMLRAVNQTG